MVEPDLGDDEMTLTFVVIALLQEKLPSYEEVSKRYGFPVPKDYYEFLKLAFESAPEDPWNAFADLGLGLKDSFANPKYKYAGHDYADTPAEAVVFAWTGGDGVHYAFAVDDVPDQPSEFPIVEVYPAWRTRLLGLTFRDFLTMIISQWVEPDDKEDLRSTFGKQAQIIQRRFALTPLRNPEEARQKMIKKRYETAIPTSDEFGIVLPVKLVDREYLSGLRWQKVEDLDRKPNAEILTEAERRLAKKEYGTALVLARNFRYLYWYEDWKSNKRYIQLTSSIMAECYEALGRKHAAQKVKSTTEWALREVQ